MAEDTIACGRTMGLPKTPPPGLTTKPLVMEGSMAASNLACNGIAYGDDTTHHRPAAIGMARKARQMAHGSPILNRVRQAAPLAIS